MLSFSTMPALSTNGLIPHPSFPVAPYEAVQAAVVRWSGTDLYQHYSGAWNALAYRFQGAVDAGDRFQHSLATHGAHPIPQERYHQERALFEFFSNGFAAFEAAFYGAFAIGAFIDGTNFSLATPRDQQRVTPAQAAEAYRRAFPADPILAVIASLLADHAYLRWREMRNVLTHRTAPGRRMFVSLGADDAPPVEWKLNDLPIDEALVPNHQVELARLISDLLTGIETFITARV